MKRHVTIVEVAKNAGVAVSTVSRVLNGGYASAAVRARVEEVVQRLGFVPSTSARGLKLGRTGLIGFVAWDIQGAWATGLLGGVEDELVGRSMSVVLGSVGLRQTYDFSAVFSWIGERRVDGMILARAPEAHRKLVDLLRQAALPTVIIAPDFETDFGVKLCADNREAGRKAARHLLKLGHRRIAYFGGPRDASDSRARLDGIEEALAEQDLQLSPEEVGFGEGFTPEASTGYAKRWLSLPEASRPTGVILGNDEMAMQFMRIVMDRGYGVPQDVSVVGFDGIREGSRFWPGLTTVAQPLSTMGSTACRILMQLIDRRPEPLAEQVDFSMELVVRESTGPVPVHT